METELRRHQISLATLGTGIILFGVWSVVKTLLYFIAGPDMVLDFGPEYNPMEVLIAEIITFILFGLLFLVDLLLRVYVGRSARAEGGGQRLTNRYLIITGCMVLFNAVSAVGSLYYAIVGAQTGQSRADFAVSFVVDLTSVAMMVRLIVTARRVRQLRAELEG